MARNEYIQTLEEQLERLDQEIAKLKIKSERAGADLKAGYGEMIADLRMKQIELQPRLQELKRVGGETWVEVRGGLQTAWSDLKVAVGHAVSRFK